MKTPITYYGGKQRLVNVILPLIPEHSLYCEPFVGGAAVYFAKQKSKVEVINDYNGDVVNFYRICKTNFAILKYLVDSTPHSRKVHREAEFILKHGEQFNEIKRAWAFWIQTNMSFSARIFGGYAYARKSNESIRINRKKLLLNKHIITRMNNTDIECNDAIKVILSRDSEETFFYVDPPYYNSDCGHYKGYTLEDYIRLLEVLSKIKGKFLLSSYPSEILQSYRENFNWFQLEKTSKVSVSRTTAKDKTEVLTANYII